jgi:hypothetical protein
MAILRICSAHYRVLATKFEGRNPMSIKHLDYEPLEAELPEMEGTNTQATGNGYGRQRSGRQRNGMISKHNSERPLFTKL